MPERTTSRLLTTKEVAARLRTTPKGVVNRRHRDPSFPRGARIGREVLTPEHEVEAYITARLDERRAA